MCKFIIYILLEHQLGANIIKVSDRCHKVILHRIPTGLDCCWHFHTDTQGAHVVSVIFCHLLPRLNIDIYLNSIG